VGRLEQDRTETDCRRLVDEAVASLEARFEETEATIEVGELPVLAVEPAQVRQLLQNLIGNALKFSGDKAPRVKVSSEPENGTWRFTVEDNGIGVDPRHRERIFNMFQRLHRREDYEGTGIGLAICRKIVERHRGRIWVEESPLGGVAFCFTLAPPDTEAA
jgi:light-regulated signal transduction histidine kinase (bacteriophytochrome)